MSRLSRAIVPVLILAVGWVLWAWLAHDSSTPDDASNEFAARRTPVPAVPRETPADDSSGSVSHLPDAPIANVDVNSSRESDQWRLSGIVVTEAGQAIDEGTVELHFGSEVEVPVPLTSSGRFSATLPREPIRGATIRIHRAAFEVKDGLPTIPPLSVDEGVEWKIVIPTPWEITGQVVRADSRKPVEGVRVDLDYFVSQPGLKHLTSISERDGRIRFVATDLTYGDLCIIPKLEDGDPGTPDLRFDPLAAVRAAVTTSSRGDFLWNGRRLGPSVYFTERRDGRRGLWPTSTTRRITIPDGKPLDLGPLFVDECGELELTLLDGTTRTPIPNESIAVESPVLSIKILTPATGKDGSTRIAFEPGVHRLLCEVLFGTTRVEPEKVEIGPGHVASAIVTATRRSKSSGIEVYVRRKWDQSKVEGALVQCGEHSATSDESGIVRFDLLPGDVGDEFSVTSPESRKRSVVQAQRVQPDFLLIDLEPDGMAHARIEDPFGHPIQHAEVRWIYSHKAACRDWDSGKDCKFDGSEGRFELPFLRETARDTALGLLADGSLVGWLSPGQFAISSEWTIVVERICEKLGRLERQRRPLGEGVRIWASFQGAPPELLSLTGRCYATTDRDGWFRIALPERFGVLYAEQGSLKTLAQYDSAEEFQGVFELGN